MAVEVGMHEAERIGELHAVMVIPRPMEDLEETLPVASCWIEQAQPIAIPIELKQPQKELVAQEERVDLSEFRTLSMPEEIPNREG